MHHVPQLGTRFLHRMANAETRSFAREKKKLYLKAVEVGTEGRSAIQGKSWRMGSGDICGVKTQGGGRVVEVMCLVFMAPPWDAWSEHINVRMF